MYRHTVYCGEAIVVGKVQYYNMQYQWGMRRFYFMLGSEIERNPILPIFEFFIKLPDSVEQFPVRLL